MLAMKSTALVLASAGTVAFAVLACGSVASSGGGGGSSAGAGCGAYFDSYTAYLKQCGGQRFITDRDRWLTWCQLGVGAPGAGATDGALSRCAEDIDRASASCSSFAKTT